jgi:hypothetical protein
MLSQKSFLQMGIHRLVQLRMAGRADLNHLSMLEAKKIADMGIEPMIDLTVDLLGDGSIVKPESSILAVGGGLFMSEGYRGLLLDGLKSRGFDFGGVRVVADAAGEGAKGLARVEFG